MELTRWITSYYIVVSFLLIIVLVLNRHNVFANKLQSCHVNPCQNGGECYRAGDTVENTNCDDGWTLYRRMCYNLVKSEQMWADAFRHCRSAQANLLSIENADERKFVREFMRQELKNTGRYPFNVWTTGKLLGRDPSPIWAWTKIETNDTIDVGQQFWRRENANPNNVDDSNASSLLSNIWLSGRYFESSYKNSSSFFWLKGYDKLAILTYFWNDSNIPTAYPNNDACISVSSATEYTDWVVDHCQEKRNYFICEKQEPTVIVESNGYYNYQCRCKPGYNGFNCELRLSSLQTISQQQICETEQFQLSCSSSTANNNSKRNIVIEFAAYGQIGNNAINKNCMDRKTLDETDCVADNSLLLVAKNCNGRPSCSLQAPKRLFTANPCLPGSSGLTLEYRFRCVEEEQTCPSETIQHKKDCFEILYRDDRSDRKSWADARKYCNSKGGDIVGPVDLDVHNLLISELNKKDERKVKYFWIGLKMEADYRSQPTSGTWTNGAALDFMPEGSRLEEGECVAYYVQPPSRIVWLAKNCNYFYNWICQYSLSGPERPRLQDPSRMKTAELTETSTTGTKQLTFVSRTFPSTSHVVEPTTLVEEPREETSEVAPETEEQTITALVTTTEVTTKPSTTVRTRPSTTSRTRPSPRTMTSRKKIVPTVRPKSTPEEPDITVTRRPTKSTTTTSMKMSTKRTKITRPTTTTTIATTIEVPSETHEMPTDATGDVNTVDFNVVSAFGNSSYNVQLFANSQQSNNSANFSETTTQYSFSYSFKQPVIVKFYEKKIRLTSVPARLPIFRSPINLTTNNNNTRGSAEATTDMTNILNEEKVTLKTTASGHVATGICYNKTVRHVSWPNTIENTVAKVHCPATSYRFAFWECRRINEDVKFFPENPDLSDCRHDDIMDRLRDQVETNRPAEEITNNLYDFWLNNKKTVYGGDIYASLNLMRDVIALQKKQLNNDVSSTNKEKQAVASSFTQKVGYVIDVMLSNEVLPIWNDLPLEYKYGNATMLMYNVEDNADLLASFLDSSSEKNFTFAALTMKVEVHRPMLQTVSTTNVVNTSVLTASAHNEFIIDHPQEPSTEGVHHVYNNLPTTMSLSSDKSTISLSANGLITAVGMPQIPESGQFSGKTALVPVSANDGIVDNPNEIRVGMFEYMNGMRTLLNPSVHRSESFPNGNVVINSQIIGATVNSLKRLIILPENQWTNLTLTHLHTINVKNPRCVYWNTSLQIWDDWGCRLLETTKEYSICVCNHLTSFAILMDVTGALDQISETNRQILHYVTIVGCAISIMCLFVCIIVFSCFRILWSERNTIHRNLCICLLIGELFFVCGIDSVQSPNVCTSVAVLLQYFFLAAFSWMLIEGYQLYRMLIKVFETEKSFMLIYYLISYGCPAIITAISVGIRFKDYGTDKYCWINVRTSTIWAFAAPVALVVFINVIFLAMALKAVFSVSVHDKSKLQKMKGWLKGSTMLLSLLGITWIFGFLCAVQSTTVYFAYIFAFLNSLQGVFIFVFHVVLNEKCHSAITRSIRRTFPNCWWRKSESLASNSTASTHLKKLSDSVRNTNSVAVRPKLPDGTYLNSSTFFSVERSYRLNNNDGAQDLHEQCLKLRDDDNVTSVNNDRRFSGGLPHNNIVTEMNSQAVRQRYAKNPRISRKETNDGSYAEENLANENSFYQQNNRTDSGGPHVLTIPTGDTQTPMYNSPKKNFVGHF